MADSDSDKDDGRSPGLRRQMQIYERGLAGKTPGQAVSVDELAHQAKAAIDREAYDYLAGGAGGEDTMRANRDAFRRWRIVPRFLRDVDRRDLSVEVLGHRLPAPVLLAPIGVQSILHKHGELAVARAARSLGWPMVLSTVSSETMEDVARELGDIPRWFQLYWPRSDDLTASFVGRAEAAGYSALVVTLDTYLLSLARARHPERLPAVPPRGGAGQLHQRPRLPRGGRRDEAPSGQDPRIFRQGLLRPLADLGRPGEAPRLDSPAARREGRPAPGRRPEGRRLRASGLIVSNHGGRQLDGALASLDALPGIVDAVGDATTVLFDSGIRRGADVFKAIALGAKAVLLGRPYCYGLAVNGEEGVKDVLLNLLADIDLTMGLAGCATWSEVGRANLTAAP